MEQDDNIFDITDETNDSLQYTTEELNRFFEFGYFNSNINEEDIIGDDFSNVKIDTQVLIFHIQATLNGFTHFVFLFI